MPAASSAYSSTIPIKLPGMGTAVFSMTQFPAMLSAHKPSICSAPSKNHRTFWMAACRASSVSSEGRTALATDLAVALTSSTMFSRIITGRLRRKNHAATVAGPEVTHRPERS